MDLRNQKLRHFLIALLCQVQSVTEEYIPKVFSRADILSGFIHKGVKIHRKHPGIVSRQLIQHLVIPP